MQCGWHRIILVIAVQSGVGCWANRNPEKLFVQGTKVSSLLGASTVAGNAQGIKAVF